MNTRKIRILRRKSWLGKLLRLPFKLIPSEAVLPILSGKLKGCKWIKGSHNISIITGTYERNQSKLFCEYASKVSVFWDLGAHVGYYSLLFAKSNPVGTIMAVEPLQKNVDYYNRHMALNVIDRFTLFPVAISNTTGKLSFNTKTTTVAGKLTEGGDIQVDVVKLSDWVKEKKIAVPGLIKMDIEGEEFKVLSDLKDVLVEHKPVIFLSTHGVEVHNKCLEILRECKYSMKPLDALDLSSAKEVLAY